MRIKQSGITLLELIVVVAIVAIIASVAYPSFTDGLRKSRRAEALKGLLSMQPETGKSSGFPIPVTAPPSQVGNPTSSYYDFSISGATATSYTLIATSKGAQAGDKSGSTACDTLDPRQRPIPRLLPPAGDRLPALGCRHAGHRYPWLSAPDRVSRPQADRRSSPRSGSRRQGIRRRWH